MSGRRYKKREMVPQRQQPATNSTQIAAYQAEYFSGPIPPPALLARYNEVVPDGAERILSMAERQSKHRESLEAQVVAGNIQSQRRGTLYGFIVTLVAIIGGIYLVAAGKNASGLATIISSLAGLVAVFVYARRQQSKERIEKAGTLAQRRRQ